MSAPSFFEGPEKKVELALRDASRSLRSLGDDFWHQVVQAADAQVLSTLRSESCDAYLLSESSLFVYDAFLTMITCGRTRLVRAVEHIVAEVGAENVALLTYERKNEHFPDRQYSTFYDDARALNAIIPGRAIRFGDEHDHHVHLYHSSADYEVPSNDTTLEILMHGLPDEVAARFVGMTPPKEGTIIEAHGFGALMPGFAIDEHAFTPAGYSMNGLRGDDYYTIHVTPEELGSYVSFETNLDFRPRFNEIVAGVVEVFQPRSFDVLSFCPAASESMPLEQRSHEVKDHVRDHVHGYAVDYWHCFKPQGEGRRAIEVPLR